MSATAQALKLLEKRPFSPEAEVLRFILREPGAAFPAHLPGKSTFDWDAYVAEAAEDLACRYIVALAVSKGYDAQLDSDLEAALAEARKRQG